ncbi:MAG TPA: DUF5700 domain-containing putative Zn-dependent protease [Gemmatimonadaceae bacterium]
MSVGTAGVIDVQIAVDEADAALAILDAQRQGVSPSGADWQRLFGSTGYQHLKEREASMGRGFTDSAFRAFLLSDTLLRRVPALDTTVPRLARVDASAAAQRALGYLPPGTPLRARMYLEIKPRTNSFVFTGRDSVPSIFLYVRPDESPAQLENTLAHELHHIGLNAACPTPAFARVSPAEGMLLRYLGAFGEGQAMLAAAGSPAVHPHAADDDTIRARWDRDVAHASADIEELSRFFASVLDGRLTSADSVRERAATYYGVQGPWYTVGWLMAATVERELGRPTLVGSLCEPTRFLALYDDAARQANRRRASLPLWSASLLARLERLRAAAG